MESSSTLDRSFVDRNVQAGTKLADAANLDRANLGLNSEEDMQQEGSRTSQASISAALAAANAALRDIPSVNLARPDNGRSLAEMAQRDLDAALQLLTDRAQYITGSSGAAIALRRNGTNDMQCRASTGSNAPELGTLLSTEFGLSGESVRTRRALRCDDAERDARVNRDVCREVGIASVVVMPVVHDDEVLGVFELFSGKAHAFGERDMSALQRLSEMVETAVRLAQAAQFPERLKVADVPAAAQVEKTAADILEAQDEANGLVIEEPIVEVEAVPSARQVVDEPMVAKVTAVAASAEMEKIWIESPAQPPVNLPSAEPVQSAPTSVAAASPASPVSQADPVPASPAPVKKTLLWSASANVGGDALKSAVADESHVPPAFRNLRKCTACGFPVSAERTLCVECEEKKWRGQLKPRATAAPSTSGAAAAAAPAPEIRKDIPNDVRKALAIAATVQSARVKEQKTEPKENVAQPQAQTLPKKTQETQASPVHAIASQMLPNQTLTNPTSPTQAAKPTTAAKENKTPTVQAAPPALVFSAALEPSQSWLGRNKYVLGAMLVVGGTVAAILLLR